MLNECVNAKIKIKKDEEVVDVCEAIEKMKAKAAREAVREAEQKAIQKAQKKAQKEILKAQKETQKAQSERISSLFSYIKSLMEKMGWSLEQSMEVLSVSESDQKEIRKLIKVNA